MRESSRELERSLQFSCRASGRRTKTRGWPIPDDPEPRPPRSAPVSWTRRSRSCSSDGYAAVTSRRVEAEAGLKLHYHFGTLDDLFVAVFRRRAERNVERMTAALASPEPLRAWWELASDPRGRPSSWS